MNRPNYMQVINNNYDKYAEYFEMAGDQSPLLMNHLLAKQLLAAQEQIEYLRTINESYRRP